jgi:hypothetical protein
LSKHACESYAVGRAQVSRQMIDTIYVSLQTVLDEVEEPIPPSNIWNFDEINWPQDKIRQNFFVWFKGGNKE